MGRSRAEGNLRAGQRARAASQSTRVAVALILSSKPQEGDDTEPSKVVVKGADRQRPFVALRSSDAVRSTCRAQAPLRQSMVEKGDRAYLER